MTSQPLGESRLLRAALTDAGRAILVVQALLLAALTGCQLFCARQRMR